MEYTERIKVEGARSGVYRADQSCMDRPQLRLGRQGARVECTERIKVAWIGPSFALVALLAVKSSAGFSQFLYFTCRTLFLLNQPRDVRRGMPMRVYTALCLCHMNHIQALSEEKQV